MQEASNHNLGHRKRVKERFLKTDLRSLEDYEILEMMLFHALPRADTKTIAKDLLRKFGSLQSILGAEKEDLVSVQGVGESVVLFLRLMLDFNTRLCVPADNSKNFNVLSNWHAVLNYCRITMGYKKKSEFFRVLYLNRKNCLLGDELHNEGTIDKIQIYPREIARKVLEYGASAVILVHNHPSGDTSPSKEDVEITKSIAKAIEPFGAVVHDHLIISEFDYFSFKGNKLL